MRRDMVEPQAERQSSVDQVAVETKTPPNSPTTLATNFAKLQQMQQDLQSDTTNQSHTKYPFVTRFGTVRQEETDHANASQDEQSRSTTDEREETLYIEQDATNLMKGQSSDDDQIHVEAATSSHDLAHRSNDRSDENCASIVHLMEMDGVRMDPESNDNVARRAKQAFKERVDQLEAATVTAHKEYWDRLQHVYPASTVKRMRLTAVENLRTTVTTQPRNDHEALDTLAVAAASGFQHVDEQEIISTDPVATTVKKAKRTYSPLHNSLPLGNRASEGTDNEQHPVQVHDPTLTEAVDKLTNKLMQLVVQLEAASDAAAAESIMAAAALIAVEAAEMGRYEEAALARIMEIEEHRLEVMQGLLEYAKRKQKRKNNNNNKEEEENKDGAFDLMPRDSSAKDTEVDETQL
ncbi:unnamed protein product [Peronospora belbahrii]|uniref:Uncharacterized protein n=1 Tax=Peronospora belbahrii TaxID=622444 RepID=A0ABN8CLM5_9STRA|nr:unnamed protein product [Peronospora belbahrii]